MFGCEAGSTSSHYPHTLGDNRQIMNNCKIYQSQDIYYSLPMINIQIGFCSLNWMKLSSLKKHTIGSCINGKRRNSMSGYFEGSTKLLIALVGFICQILQILRNLIVLHISCYSPANVSSIVPCSANLLINVLARIEVLYKLIIYTFFKFSLNSYKRLLKW